MAVHGANGLLVSGGGMSEYSSSAASYGHGSAHSESHSSSSSHHHGHTTVETKIETVGMDGMEKVKADLMHALQQMENLKIQAQKTIVTHKSFDEESEMKKVAHSNWNYFGAVMARANMLRQARYGSLTRDLKVITESTLISSEKSGYFRELREHDKKALIELNDRFAAYIEQVRYLSVYKEKLNNDWKFLKNTKLSVGFLDEMIAEELAQYTYVLDLAIEERKETLWIISQLEEKMLHVPKYDHFILHREPMTLEIDKLLVELSQVESQVSLMKHRNALIESDISLIKKDTARIKSDLQRIQVDIDQETMTRNDYHSQYQNISEEVNFSKTAQDHEIADMIAFASRDTTRESREYFRKELHSAIQELRTEYEEHFESDRIEIESRYRLKIQEIQTQYTRQQSSHGYAKEDITRIHNELAEVQGNLMQIDGKRGLIAKQIADINDERARFVREHKEELEKKRMEKAVIQKKLDDLAKLKVTLSTEKTLDVDIDIYGKILNKAEHHKYLHIGEKIQPIAHDDEYGHRSYQRFLRGDVDIKDIGHDGSYVQIENSNHHKVVEIGGWQLVQEVENDRAHVFVFPDRFVLGPGKTVTVWARGHGRSHGIDELVANTSWIDGHHARTSLKNMKGEERAIYQHVHHHHQVVHQHHALGV